MKTDKKELLMKIFQVIIFINLGIFLFLIYLARPFWFGVKEFLVSATGIDFEWFALIMGISWLLFFLYGAAFILLILKRFSWGKFISFLWLRYLNLPVFIIWNGLLAVMILEAGSAIFLSSLQYLYYEYRLPYLLILVFFHAWLSVILFQRGRIAAGFIRYRNFSGAAGTAFAVGMFLLNGAQHISSGDNRAFPREVMGKKEAVDYVNPLIGTHGPYEYGSTAPLVAVPFGMTHWTPMNQEISPGVRAYRYYQKKIRGFLATHRPAIWMGDYGQVALMPGTGKIEVDRDRRSMEYRHRDETVTPYYYRVILDPDRSSRIDTEITASERCGIINFSFKDPANPHVVIDASMHENYSGSVTVNPEAGEVTGYNSDRYSDVESKKLKKFRGYFVIVFDRPVTGFGTYLDREYGKGRKSLTGNRIGAVVRFSGAESVTARVGTSFISLEQARENLRREIPRNDFEAVKRKTRQAWQEQLEKIEIKTADDNQKGVFYTSLYRSLLFPRIFSEYGRYYSPFDEKIHSGVSYNDYSLWDTFRALHPLLILVVPQRVPGMITSLIQMYREGGYMPKWPNPTYTNIMIGTHADSVIADAYIKGIRGFDAREAYRAMKKNALTPPEGDRSKKWGDRDPYTSYEARGGLSWYMKYGYIPADKTKESVARTVEFSYGDFCLAEMAGALNYKEDSRLFGKRSRNYRNLYRNVTRFMAPRKSDGSWHPNQTEGFTEGSPWTYLFGAMHDVPGMIELMGGKKNSFSAWMRISTRGTTFMRMSRAIITAIFIITPVNRGKHRNESGNIL